MTAKQLRIMVSGDVEGRLTQLYSRINNIQQKSGAFDLLLCVGDFFGDSEDDWNSYVSGKSKAPISTLILGPNKGDHVKFYKQKEGCDLCENITYLGRRGIFSGSSGLQIAYLSGVESANNTSDDIHFNSDDVLALTVPLTSDTKFKGVDILITSQWPKEVENYGGKADNVNSSQSGSAALCDVAMALRPRYHFVASEGVYYERQPYRNHTVLSEGARHVSRFISLAKVGNMDKKKYLYAFNITPMSHMDPTELVKQPADVTECPFKANVEASKIQQRITEEMEEAGSQFFFDMKAQDRNDGKRKHNRQDDRYSKRQDRKPPQPTGPCWFCLGSPEVEKHLVVSVGMHTYLALAKGSLTPDHVLILPIVHHQSTVAAPSEIIDEIDQYKAALRKYFKAENKAVVFFERNYKTQHLQIQVIPIPLDAVMDVKEAFTECAESESFELHEIPKHSDLKQIVPAGAPYFYADLPSGEKLLHRISKHFPLQFGREAVTAPNILNMPERIDWKNCKLSKSEETSQASEFKSSFKTYDFNL